MVLNVQVIMETAQRAARRCSAPAFTCVQKSSSTMWQAKKAAGIWLHPMSSATSKKLQLKSCSIRVAFTQTSPSLKLQRKWRNLPDSPRGCLRAQPRTVYPSFKGLTLMGLGSRAVVTQTLTAVMGENMTSVTLKPSGQRTMQRRASSSMLCWTERPVPSSRRAMSLWPRSPGQTPQKMRFSPVTQQEALAATWASPPTSPHFVSPSTSSPPQLHQWQPICPCWRNAGILAACRLCTPALAALHRACPQRHSPHLWWCPQGQGLQYPTRTHWTPLLFIKL